MKRYVFISLLLFFYLLNAEIVPKNHISYFEISKVISKSNFVDLKKYQNVNEGLTKKKMAEILAEILINNSYIDVNESSKQKYPIFYNLKDVLSELKNLTMFLKKELAFFNIDTDYLLKQYEEVKTYIAKEKIEMRKKLEAMDEEKKKKKISKILKLKETEKEELNKDRKRQFIKRKKMKYPLIIGIVVLTAIML